MERERKPGVGDVKEEKMRSVYVWVDSLLSAIYRGVNWYAEAVAKMIYACTYWLGPYRTVLVACLFMWGIWIGSPWWSLYGNTANFEVMIKVASGQVWGIIFCLISIGVVVGKALGSRSIEQYFVLAMAVSWITISLVLSLGNPYSTATVVYFTLSLLTLLNWRIKDIGERYE